MKIVKFRNGKYAIRKWCFFGGYEYKDLKNKCHWWGKEDIYFNDCMGTLEEVKKGWNFLNDSGRVVKL